MVLATDLKNSIALLKKIMTFIASKNALIALKVEMVQFD